MIQLILFLSVWNNFAVMVLSEKFKIHIATMEGITYAPFGLPWAGAAIDMAVEHITEKYKDIIQFNHTLRVVGSGPTEAGAAAAELYHMDKVDVFIGPGSSASVEAIAYMVTMWNMPLVSPTGGAGIVADSSLFPTLTRVSPFNVGSYAKFYIQLLETYKWKHFVVIYDSVGHSYSLWLTLKGELDKTTKYSWTYYETVYSTFEDKDYEHVFNKANKYARVFILLAQRRSIRKIALAAHRVGFTKGDHVMLTTAQYTTRVPESYWKNDDEFDEIAKEAFRSFVFLALPTFELGVFDEFATELKNRSLRDYNFDYRHYDVSPYAVSYYDSFNIFAQVANESLAAGENPLNGSALSKRMWNRTFTGIGGRVVINENGTRDSDLVLMSIDPMTGVFRIVGGYKGDKDQYYIDEGVIIHWPNNRGPPPDVPLCGFRNDQCASETSNVMITAISATFGIIAFIAALLTFIFVRRWKVKSEADQWWWRIDPRDLKLTDYGKYGSGVLSLTSKVSLMTNKEDTPFLDYIVDTALYKGSVVRVRKIPMKNIIVTKKVLAEFKQLRDLNQSNLIRLVGASLDDSPKYLVTEFCAKGTLQDLLGNSRLGLDTHFKFSLCIDIAQGMCYLHDSAIHKHGRLTSITCLIDNRFSVKLTDFGLNCIYDNLILDKETQEFKTECLWKAPETLRDKLMTASQAGDVYSYGIILQEVITREAPYSEETDSLDVDKEKHTAVPALESFGKIVLIFQLLERRCVSPVTSLMAAILEKIRKGGVPPLRPHVEVPQKLDDLKSLMEACWSEDPSGRPTFHIIKKSLKRLAARFGASGNLLDNLLRRMEQYANNLEKLVDEKTMELRVEKKKSEELLYQILPRSVAGKLRQGERVDPEDFGCVTIYFSDICGFTTISARSTPFQVVDLLNDLYTCFDAIIDNFDVYKVETIGDAYMVVSGLPQRNGRRHVLEIARMSLALLKGIETFTIRHLPDEKLRLRIGLHSGPVVAGVVGLKMPRYCLFGDTVNTASRMESHGQELKIHMSDRTTELLSEFDIFFIDPRGITDIKGKGQMETFWLMGERATTSVQEGGENSTREICLE